MPNCPRCKEKVDLMDCYCRYCGRALQPRMGFWYSHSGILLQALCIGPFALICVWLSRRISPLAKWLWTLSIVLCSAYIVYGIYQAILLFLSVLTF